MIVDIEKVAKRNAENDAQDIIKGDKTVHLTCLRKMETYARLNRDRNSCYYMKGEYCYSIYTNTLASIIDNYAKKAGIRHIYNIPNWNSTIA